MSTDQIYKLEDFIDLGYQWIEKIEEEYSNTPRENTSSLLGKYYRLVKEWEDQVKSSLPNASRGRKFSAAKSTDPTYQANKSVDVQNLVKSIRAKIEVLEEYRRELNQPSINLGPQARFNYQSTDNSTNVIGDQYTTIVNQIETEIEKNYTNGDKEELLELVSELKKSQKDGGKTREILGTLLTRGSEVAQIASLVAQILMMLPK
jgi:hypothetical protein